VIYLVTFVLYLVDVFLMNSDSSCFQVRGVPVGDVVLLGSTIEVLPPSEVVSVDFLYYCATYLHEHAEIYRAADVVFFCILPTYIAGVIPRSLQLHAHVLAILGSCHKSGQCAKSCARRSVCLCRAVGEPLLFCLGSSCYHVIEIGGR
jgi:hypothetical protein